MAAGKTTDANLSPTRDPERINRGGSIGHLPAAERRRIKAARAERREAARAIERDRAAVRPASEDDK